MRSLDIARIQATPTVVGRVHESVYRASAVLDMVETLLERRDSHETILELLRQLRQAPTIDPECEQP